MSIYNGVFLEKCFFCDKTKKNLWLANSDGAIDVSLSWFIIAVLCYTTIMFSIYFLKLMVSEYIENKNSWKFIIGYILHLVTERSSHLRWSIKWMFLKFRKIDRKTHVSESLFNKVASGPLKRHPVTSVSLWILRNF